MNTRLSRVLSASAIVIMGIGSTRCVSVGVARYASRDSTAKSGGLQVAVYDTPDQARDSVPSDSGATVQVARHDAGRAGEVLNVPGSTGSFDALPAGSYRLSVRAAVSGPTGGPGRLLAEKTVRIHSGETVRANVILKKFPTGAVIGAVAGAGAVVLIASAISSAQSSGLGNLRVAGKRSARSKRGHKCLSNLDAGRTAISTRLAPE